MGNTTADRDLRRYQDVLYTVGTGSLALGIWSAFRVVLAFAVGDFDEYIDLSNEIYFIATVALLTVMIGIDLALRFYVCVHARAEALGRARRRHSLYLVAAGILACWHLFSIVLTILSYGSNDYTLLECATGIIIDFTIMCLLVYLITAAVRIRRMAPHDELPTGPNSVVTLEAGANAGSMQTNPHGATHVASGPTTSQSQ